MIIYSAVVVHNKAFDLSVWLYRKGPFKPITRECSVDTRVL